MAEPPHKHRSLAHYALAMLYRESIRFLLRNQVAWLDKKPALEPGCTAIIGMAHWLKDILPVNLECLRRAQWPDLKEVIVTVDSVEGCLPEGFEERMKKRFPSLNLRFYYYSKKQRAVSQFLKLPYVFAWMSWAIAIAHCRTKTVLIQDYDALVFGDALCRRYEEFVRSGAWIQGVEWYKVNGIVPEDRMACTFEAFVDVAWIWRYRPIDIFNKIGKFGKRRVDFDTFIRMQALDTPQEKRTIVPMSLEELVHPTQMIHQYTVFKKHPARPWFCSATTMIPLYFYLSGKSDALEIAVRAIDEAVPGKNVDMLGDGCIINYSQLRPHNVDWMLEQMIRVCVQLGYEPIRALADYGDALYKLCDAPPSKIWLVRMNDAEKLWVQRARQRTAAGGAA